MSIQAVEREKYEAAWSMPAYSDHSPGQQWADAFLAMSEDTWGGSVLDAGCGGGKGALALQERGFKVTLCDLTNEGLMPEVIGLPFVQASLWSDLKRTRGIGFHDWVYCCDVMEHIPTEWTMLVLTRLMEVARRGVFLSITFIPDHFGLFLGSPLHLTVQSFTWWKARLEEVGTIVECRDLLESGLFLVKPR